MQPETPPQPSAPTARETEKAPSQPAKTSQSAKTSQPAKTSRRAAGASGREEKAARPAKKPAARAEKTPSRPLDRTFHPLERTARPAEKPAARPEKNAAAAGRKHPADRAFHWTLGDYLLQLSVVVIGVMITFIGSGLVSRWQKAREVRTVMQLVYEELKTDRELLEFICGELAYDRQGMLHLREHDMDYRRVPVDTLRKYQTLLGRLRDFSPRSDALEVLRSSGSISSVGDKALLFDILECYSWMNDLASGVNSYNSQKIGSLNHLFAAGTLPSSMENMEPLTWWRTMLSDPMCAAFFGSMTGYFGNSIYNGSAVGRVDSVMETLNAKYGFE